MIEAEENTASGPPGDLRRREPPGPGQSSQGRHVSVESQPNEGAEAVNSVSSSQPSASSPPTGDQPTEQIVDIVKIWMLRNKGARFPAADKNRWKPVKFAEDYWTKESEESAKRLDAYSTNLASSNNQLYQLIGFYIVFQGVLLTAVVQTNRLNCRLTALPLVLCVIAGCFFVFGVYFKFEEIKHFRSERDRFNDINKRRESQLSKLKVKREKYNFKELDEEFPSPPNLTRWINSTLCGLILVVLVFTLCIGILIGLVLCYKP